MESVIDDYVELRLGDDMDVRVREMIMEDEAWYRCWKLRLALRDLPCVLAPKEDAASSKRRPVLVGARGHDDSLAPKPQIAPPHMV